MKKGVMIFALLMAVCLSTSVAAFGISSPYWKENPLVMSPGESKEVHMTLQNMVGDEDLTVQAALVSGSEIATLTDESNVYEVKAGTADTKVNMDIVVPEDAMLEDSYNIVVSISTVTSSEGGGVSLGSAIDKSFEVIIEAPVPEEEMPAYNTTVLWTVVIVAALILLWWILQKKQRKKFFRR